MIGEVETIDEKKEKERQRRKRERVLEQKRKIELKKLEKQLKRCNPKERENLEKRIEKLINKKNEINEKNFDIMVNTMKNEQNRHQNELNLKKKQELKRQELVKKGVIEDKLYLAGKNKLDDKEIQEILVSKIYNHNL